MKLMKGLSAVLIGLMGSQLSFAGDIDTRALSHQCMDTAYQLTRIAELHSASACAGDVKLASAYIEATSNELYLHKIPQALHSITYGEHGLQEMTTSHGHCMGLAPELKPYLARVIIIKSEIELLLKNAG